MAMFLRTNALRNDQSLEFADLTLNVGREPQNREFKAHKFIVCPQSEFLMLSCTGHFVEAIQDRIDLPEDDPEIICRVVDYLYYQHYNDQYEARAGAIQPSATPSDTALIANQDVDREFHADAGSGQSRNAFKASLRKGHFRPTQFQYPNNHRDRIDIHARVYTCALRLGIPTLQEYSFAQLQDIEPFVIASTLGLSTLDYVYDNTLANDRLRRRLTEVCVEYSECLNDPVLQHNPFGPELVKLLEKHEPLAWRIGCMLWRKIRNQEEELLRQNLEAMELKSQKVPRMKNAGSQTDQCFAITLADRDTTDEIWYECESK